MRSGNSTKVALAPGDKPDDKGGNSDVVENQEGKPDILVGKRDKKRLFAQ